MLKRLILALCLALAAMPAWATWAQTNNKTASGTTNPISTAAFTNALHNPSIIIATVRITGSTNTSTPYDTAGNTYIDSGTGQIKYNSNARTIQVFYALNTSTTASDVVSLANSSGFALQIIAEEWTGGATSSPIDGTPASNPNANTGTGGGQNMTVGPTTPTSCGDLIIGAAGDSSGTPTFTIGTGFTAQTVAGTRTTVEYLVQITPAAISATWNDSVNSDDYGAIVAAFKAASQSCSASPSESHATSDAIARLASFGRGDSETNTASDVIARVRNVPRSDTETNIPSDAIARLAGFGRGDTETNTASDALARLASFGRGDSESNAVSDAILRSQGLSRADSESNTASDFVGRLAGFGRGDSEANPASDALARLAIYGRGDSETNIASDAIARLHGIIRADTESNTASDTIARSGVFGRVETETNTTGDSLARLASFARNDSEALSVTDNLMRVFAAIRGETEALSTSDNLGRVLAARRGDTEILAFADSIVVLRNYRLIVLPRHAFAVPGQGKTGAVPGQAKTGVEAGRVKSGTVPVH
jgi:hypothetical protein